MPEAVSIETPQPLLTPTEGAGGMGLGADVAVPIVLVHPLTVCVTVYVAELVTLIAVLLAPVFHNNEPVNEPAVKSVLPQLLTTDTVGADGITLGLAVPLPLGLAQPSMV